MLRHTAFRSTSITREWPWAQPDTSSRRFVGVLRRKRKERATELPPLPERWQRFVADAVEVRRRWHEVVAGLREGPVRDRLVELGDKIDAGVLAVHATASRASDAERIAATLDADRVTEDYKRAKRDPGADPALLDALTARFTSVQRVLNALDDVDRELRLLDVRLGAVVARGAEVALTAGQGSDELGRELDAVVAELGALQQSLDSLG